MISTIKIPESLKRRMRDETLAKLLKEGHKRIVLYGAGQHALVVIEEWKDRGIDIGFLLDDAAVRGARKFDRPVRLPTSFRRNQADGIVICSDAFEEELWKKSEALRRRGIAVYRIYGADAVEGRPDERGHDSYEDIFRSIALWNPEAYHIRDGLSEENAVVYHRYSRRHIHDVMYDALARHIPDNASILDVGSGRGWDTRRLSIRFPRASVTGMEYAPTGVELSRRYESEQLRFVEGDATRMPFEDGRFDAVFSLATIEHVADPPAMIREIFRVLKPGGFSLVATHPETYWSFWFKERYESSRKAGGGFDFHGLKASELAEMHAQTGFAPVEFSCTGFVIPQNWLRHFQGIDFKKLFAFQALAGWIYRGVGLRERLYYQYHLVRKQTGAPILPDSARQHFGAEMIRHIHRLAATPLYWLIEPVIEGIRGRCEQLG